MLFGSRRRSKPTAEPEDDRSIVERRKQVKEQLAAGKLENEADRDRGGGHIRRPCLICWQAKAMSSMGTNMQEMFGQFMPKKAKKRKLPVKEARKALIAGRSEQADRYGRCHCRIGHAGRSSRALFSSTRSIRSPAPSRGAGPDVSREGVQRDILADRRRLDGHDQIRSRSKRTTCCLSRPARFISPNRPI